VDNADVSGVEIVCSSTGRRTKRQTRAMGSVRSARRPDDRGETCGGSTNCSGLSKLQQFPANTSEGAILSVLRMPGCTSSVPDMRRRD
jgi:hypothetical protein